MNKVLLVEDDKSLREVYGVRLLAEGYDIVTAGNGEEALAMAIKERPQLIIADIMMPEISGFDMLDILRSTSETRNIKVIIMTALGGEDQRQRGEQMGAARYLVKSQVGIEDVVNTVHEVLGDKSAEAEADQPKDSATQTMPSATPANTNTAPQGPAAQASQPNLDSVTPPPAKETELNPTAAAAPSLREKIIAPLTDSANKPIDINELLNKELAKNDQPMPPVSDVAPASSFEPQSSPSTTRSMPPQPGAETISPAPATPPAAPPRTSIPVQSPPRDTGATPPPAATV